MDRELPGQQTADRQLPVHLTGLVEAQETAKISPSFIFVLEKAGAC